MNAIDNFSSSSHAPLYNLTPLQLKILQITIAAFCQLDPWYVSFSVEPFIQSKLHFELPERSYHELKSAFDSLVQHGMIYVWETIEADTLVKHFKIEWNHPYIKSFHSERSTAEEISLWIQSLRV